MYDLIISFTGLDAANGHIEVFAGLESAAGIGRALALIAHYTGTGEVRYRYPFSDEVIFYLESTEEGSFNFRVKVIAGTIAIGIATNAIYDLGKLVLSKAIGEEATSLSSDVKLLDERRSGDIEALIEAIEPALKKGHYGVGSTIKKIEIYEEKTKRTIVTFDGSSKDYLNTNNDVGASEQDVSISALNVNDRTGRAYLLDLKRTVPFVVSRDAPANTMAILSTSLDRYAKKRSVAPIRLTFRRIEAGDGRLKRLIVTGARDVSLEE